jgi:hypothetical protein
MAPPGRCREEFGMKWHVMLELVGPDWIVGVPEAGGRAAMADHAPRMIGLTVEEASICLLRCRCCAARASETCRESGDALD